MRILSRAVNLTLAVFLSQLGPAVAKPTFSQEPNKKDNVAGTDSEPIVLTVTVTNDDGEPVTGLRKDQFIVFDNKIAQKLVYFSDGDLPISVGILFDVSASVKGTQESGAQRLAIIKNALSRFLQMSNSANEYFLIGFNQRPQLLQDWTTDSSILLEKVSALQLKGNTAFYDACYLAIDKIRSGHFSRRALIVISDGEDNVSNYTFAGVKRLLKESNASFYSINVLPTLPPGYTMSSWALGEGGDVLVELSSISGGMTFLPNEKEANAAFERIAEVLHHQYLIGFNSNSSGQRQAHQIKVKLSLPLSHPREKRHLIIRFRQTVRDENESLQVC